MGKKETKLDEKDSLIIEALLKDARLSTHELAKMLKTTQPTAHTRLRKLEKEGYLARYDSLINWEAFPFIKKIYFCNLTKQEEIYISKKKECFVLIKVHGYLTHMIWCFFKTKKQMVEFERLIPKKRKILELKNLYSSGISLSENKFNLNKPLFEFNRIKLTPSDIKVMRVLSEGGARESLKDISNKTGLNIDQAWYSKKKLIKNGYFSAFVAQPGVKEFNLTMTNLFIKTKKKVRLDEIPRVFTHMDTSEGVGCVIVTKNMQDYLDTLDKIYSLFEGDIEQVLLFPNKEYIVLNKYPFEYLL
jgi:DNA-binding Lrp family transcriptional regulator